MDKYLVGNGAAGKDQYKVGRNGKDQYKVGGGGQAMGGGSNSKFVSFGSGDPVVESKSQFDYPYNNESTTKDVGDRGENSNLGGAVQNGIQSQKVNAGGEISMEYDQKSGDWDAKKDAMARRKGMMDSQRQYMGKQEFNSPVPDGYPDKI